MLGYRALYVDYSRGTGSDLFRMNILQHGPLRESARASDARMSQTAKTRAWLRDS